MADEGYDLEALNVAFAQLRDTAGARVTPPGIAAARATAKRRQKVRMATLAAVVIALIVIPVATFAKLERDVAITPTPSPSASTSESPSPSPSSSPTPPPSQAPSAASVGGSSGSSMSYTPIWYVGALANLRVDLPRAQSFAVPIGIKVWTRSGGRNGQVTNAKLTIDMAQLLSKVEPVSVTGPCAIAGATVSCDFGTLAVGDHTASLTLRARPGAAVGEVGQVNLTSSADQPSGFQKTTYSRIYIGSFDTGTDYTIRSSINSGRVGDTLTITADVTNRGPSMGTYYEIQPYTPAGAELVGMSANCLPPAQLSTGCRLENIAVGATVRVQFSIHISACISRGYMAGVATTHMPYDPITYEPNSGDMSYRITGC